MDWDQNCFRNYFIYLIKIAKTGALCCVASGPQGEKSNSVSRGYSMDHGEPHWRTNSSFSPPFSRRWDCSLHSDGLSHGIRRAPFVGSSLSSHGKGSRRNTNPRHYQNHHHSMSDGALSYNGSPSDSYPPPRWTSPAQRYDQREFSTPAGGNLRSFIFILLI